MARFVVRAGKAPGTEHPLPPDITNIAMGRESGDIRVPDGGASRDHAEIVRRGDDLFIRDLGSRNGTLLNKRRLEGEVRLAFGDHVRIGNTIYELVADESDVAKVLAAPPPDSEQPAAGGALDALRSLPPRAQRVIGLGMLALLIAAVTVGMLLGSQGASLAEGQAPSRGRPALTGVAEGGGTQAEDTPAPVIARIPGSEQDSVAPPAPVQTAAAAAKETTADVTEADVIRPGGPRREGGRPGWYAVLTDRLAASVSSVMAAPEDGTEEGEGGGGGGAGDLRGIATRLLAAAGDAEAGDAAPEEFVEPDVDERAFVPADEPEGDIDFEAEEAAAKVEAEKRAEANGAGEGAEGDRGGVGDGDRPATARPKRVTTASGREVDADALLAPLPRTLKCRLTPKTRKPFTDADRANVNSALGVLRTTPSASRFGSNSYNRIAALKGLTRYDDPSVSRSLVFLARDRDPGVRKALADVLAGHDNLESVKILFALISQGDAVLGVSAAAALASLRDEETVEWLYTSALKRGSSGTVRGAVAEALGRIGEERAIPNLVKALGDGRSEARAGAAIALGRFREASAVKPLVRLTRDRDPGTRVATLLALGSIRGPAAVPGAIRCLKDREPRVRSAAARALGALRAAESVGPLVEALGKEPSRVKDDIIRALTLITALRFDDNMLAWKSLVKESGDRDIVAELALAASVLDEIEAGNVEYYGIKTHSTRICFVVDISGSMQGRKLEDAKGELQKAIGRFTIKHFFNMIFFSGTADAWRSRLSQATDAVLARAKAHIYAQAATGGTNIFDSVILALKDPLVDTIFLLSDGHAGSGAITEPDAMRAGILRANARGVVIHCIGLGAHDREFMAGLAKDNNGKYVAPDERVR